ncbi:DoxX family protein [Sinomicrobium pectinilyticum]|uniref:DoxX family protein n=1 Tax=Sinomicrobium pectinilyticum TaxID=1084421 RepID=A0A3N0DR76_SINP1|nr:DoxX family protein [Sinomicrobium pectinilyticum]RNL78139.1 DoxX family protein [Sinomicrobium pectinilyticum]
MAQKKSSLKLLNVLLWVAQLLLAVSLIWAAAMKLFQPAGTLARMWPWTADYPFLVMLTGIVDLTGGIGLVLPAWRRISPKLTVFAAIGTLTLMITAIVFHISRNEASQTGINIFFAALAIFIVWGRTVKVPVRNR